MATAGVLKGVGDAFSLPTNAEEVSKTVQEATKAAELTEATLAQQLPAHAACQAAHAAANVSMNTLFGQRFEEAIKSAGIAAVASTIGSVASTNIGDAFNAQQIDSITHKLLHGMTGAVSGVIIDGKEGAAAGAFGAMAGEIIAETLLPTEGAAHDHASGKTETGNTKANRTAAAPTKAKPTYTDERIAQVHGITRLVVATGALLAGMDENGITAAVSACTTAIEHNHGATLRKREDSAAASAQDDAEEVEAAKTATHAADDAATKDADIVNAELDNEIPDYATADGDFDGDSDVEDIGFVDQKGRFVPAKGYAPNSTSGSTPGSAHAAKESTRQSTTESYLGVDAARDDAFGSMANASGRMSPTSRELYYNSERAQTDMEQAILSDDQAAYDEAFARHTLWEQTYDDRQIAMQGHRAMPDVLDQSANFVKQKAEDLYDFATEHPFQATWEAGEMAPIVGGVMTGGRNIKEVIQGEQTLTGAAVETGLAFGGANFVLKTASKGIKSVVNVAKASGAKVSSLGKRTALKATKVGGVIRADAIQAGSQLEYLAPGRVKFDGVEFRAVRDLGHISEADLVRMSKTGVAPRDINGLPIKGHHHLQQYHRNPGAFVVEILEPNHCISNSIQHPLGITGGLSEVERADWTKLRRAYYKERAKTELLNRSALNG